MLPVGAAPRPSARSMRNPQLSARKGACFRLSARKDRVSCFQKWWGGWVARLYREEVTDQILNLSSAVLKLSAKPVHLPAAFVKALSSATESQIWN